MIGSTGGTGQDAGRKSFLGFSHNHWMRTGVKIKELGTTQPLQSLNLLLNLIPSKKDAKNWTCTGSKLRWFHIISIYTKGMIIKSIVGVYTHYKDYCTYSQQRELFFALARFLAHRHSRSSPALKAFWRLCRTLNSFDEGSPRTVWVHAWLLRGKLPGLAWVFFGCFIFCFLITKTLKFFGGWEWWASQWQIPPLDRQIIRTPQFRLVCKLWFQKGKSGLESDPGFFGKVL